MYGCMYTVIGILLQNSHFSQSIENFNVYMINKQQRTTEFTKYSHNTQNRKT